MKKFVVVLLLGLMSSFCMAEEKEVLLEPMVIQLPPQVCKEIYAATLEIGKEYVADYKASRLYDPEQLADALARAVIVPIVMNSHGRNLTDLESRRFAAILFIRAHFTELVHILDDNYDVEGGGTQSPWVAALYARRICEKGKSFKIKTLYFN